MTGPLFLWRSWGPIAKPEGGVLPSGSEFVAPKGDPRVIADRSRLLGPAAPTRQGTPPPPPEIAAAFAEE